MSRAVNISDLASKDLKQVSKLLGISESDVIQKGLAIMKIYAEEAKTDHNNTGLMLRKGNKVKELVIEH